jgi:hypothetical protein
MKQYSSIVLLLALIVVVPVWNAAKTGSACTQGTYAGFEIDPNPYFKVNLVERDIETTLSRSRATCNQTWPFVRENRPFLAGVGNIRLWR